ncbi:MAG TPA: tRNA 2-selenouridine(34) synthase MnmH [Puia sp.]|jgi:tRNA 2-selenouridine synthase|nr:tRNA 2-selenouridine(34) synthase MnmH [Puia sp.]
MVYLPAGLQTTGKIMTRRITIDDLFHMPDPPPIADVRAPAEFAQGHVPGAVNLPLFTDEERARVGTTYKQQGKEAAILLGFELTGPKWAGFIRQALSFAPQKKIVLHCWRGGMRSSAMAWALDLYGFEVHLLQGGYKNYRKWVLRQFEKEYPLLVLGGMTGSGKTRILQQLDHMSEQVIDLEELARHKGSSYGTLNRLVQPTQEQFENDLAERLSALDPGRRIWIEDESQNIGKCLLPKPLWIRLRAALLFDVRVPLEQRVDALVDEYGSLDKDFLVECTERICKRLGPEQTTHAIAAIREHRMDDFIRIVLVYYDKTYRKGLSTRETDRIIPLELNNNEPALNARQLIGAARAISGAAAI